MCLDQIGTHKGYPWAVCIDQSKNEKLLMLLPINQWCLNITSPLNYSMGNKFSFKSGCFILEEPVDHRGWAWLQASSVLLLSEIFLLLCMVQGDISRPASGPLRRAGALGHYSLSCCCIFRPWDSSCLSSLWAGPSPRSKPARRWRRL